MQIPDVQALITRHNLRMKEALTCPSWTPQTRVQRGEFLPILAQLIELAHTLTQSLPLTLWLFLDPARLFAHSLAVLLSHPSAEVIQERTLLAFSIVSAVVKVLDTTTTGTGHRAKGTPQRAHGTWGHVVRNVRTEVHVNTQTSSMAKKVCWRVRKWRFIPAGCVMIGVLM